MVGAHGIAMASRGEGEGNEDASTRALAWCLANSCKEILFRTLFRNPVSLCHDGRKNDAAFTGKQGSSKATVQHMYI